MANSHRILRDNKALLLAFDQGLEHGPRIFDVHSIDPAHVMNIALEGDYTGIVLHPGMAEKYYQESYRDVPLVVKLNGRTELSHMNPQAGLTCSVDRAIKLGADAVGYTVYDGSPAEPQMFEEFGRIVDQAHDYGIPVIAWMYPRGPRIEGHDHDTDVISYAARIGLELGADFVKVKYNGDARGFNWTVRSAGRAKVLAADTEYSSDEDILRNAYDVMRAGGSGLAFGRTIWQHPRPFSLTRALHGIIFRGKSPEDVRKFLDE